MPDQWSRHLFLALCRRYGLSPYRLHRQRRNTVMVRAPRGFVDHIPEGRDFGAWPGLALNRSHIRSRPESARAFPGGVEAQIMNR
jgi:hypothetical protein